jgi:hypothetical protein
LAACFEPADWLSGKLEVRVCVMWRDVAGQFAEDELLTTGRSLISVLAGLPGWMHAGLGLSETVPASIPALLAQGCP